MPSKLCKILKMLGLTDGEIKTYLAALNLGPSSVLDLSTATGLTRQSTYNATQRLTEMGLMSAGVRDNVSIFSSEKPTKLLDFASRRKYEMESMIQDLESEIPELELQAGGGKPSVRIVEGNEGLREVMCEFGGDSVKDAYEIVDFDCVREHLTPEQLKFMGEMVSDRGKYITGIYAGEVPEPVLSLVSRKAILPHEDGCFNSIISVVSDRIVMVSFSGKPYAVIIDEKGLAATMAVLMKNTFQNLQKKSE